MSSNGNQSDTASFTVNFSLPRETIREYFDGLAKVETAKRPTSSFPIDSHTLSVAWSFLSPFLVQYATNQMNFDAKGPSPPGSRKPTEADLKNLMANFQDGRFSDSDDDDDSDIDGVDDQTNVPVSTDKIECDVDITKESRGEHIRTVINLLSGSGADDKEVLDHAISALKFIRDHPEDQESTKDTKGKAKAKKCCVDNVCATGACEVVKDDKAPGVASTTEDNFQPELKPAGKKSKIIVKPKYQPEGNAAVTVTGLTDMAKMFGLNTDGEQGKMIQQLTSGLMIGLQNGGDLGSIFGMVAKHVEKEAKKEVEHRR